MNIKWIIALTVLIIIQDAGVSGKDVRVKLCGREFIRMVVTLCGSSRLRRSAPEIRPSVSIRPHANWYSSDLISNLIQMKSSSEDQTEGMLDSFSSSSSSSSSSSLNVMESQEMSRSRLRRDVGPAGVCCRSGCTKTELVQYC